MEQPTEQLAGATSGHGVNFRFTHDQRQVLQEYWSKGMDSCSKGCSALIHECAGMASCSVEQVKHWINAEMKRQKKSGSQLNPAESVTPSQMISVSKGRKRTAFQVFCHETSSSLTIEGQSKMPVLSGMWASLSEKEKEEWREKAKGFAWISTPEQKRKTIRELITSTKENLKSLATLGIEGYGVLLNVSTSDCHVVCGSETAQGFIDAEEANGHAVDNTFFKYMCGQSYLKKRRKGNTYDEMLASVRYELSQKYRNVTGKGRIPYSDLTKLGCFVSGLPQGIEFKQPKLYSSSELRKLFDNIDHVKFLTISESDLNTVTLEVGREETIAGNEDEESVIEQELSSQ